MTQELGRSAQRVQEALNAFGADFQVIVMPADTRTSAQAAAAVGCEIAQIAKSVVFRGMASGQGVMVVASGANRVDEKKVAALVGEPIGKADADFVREKTGFVIGGVAPVAHAEKLKILVDEDLVRLEEIWAAAGAPNTLFRLSGPRLAEITGGTVGDVKA